MEVPNRVEKLIETFKNPGTRVIVRLLYKSYPDNSGIRVLQTALNAMGRNLVVDGDIGNITATAIKSVNNKELHRMIERLVWGSGVPVPTTDWLKYAYRELGVKEVPGKGSNPRVEQYHDVAGGAHWKDDVPWCASFVTFVMVKAGYTPPKFPARAKSWLNFGRSAGRPVMGSIAVKSRKGGGHVTFVVGKDRTGKYLYCLGGNQSDEVNIRRYKASSFISFRMPSDVSPTAYKEPPVVDDPSKLTYLDTGSSEA